MNNYTQLNKAQILEIENAAAPEHMDKILSQYYLQVFKVINICDEGEQNYRYFLAEVESDLKSLPYSWIERIV